MTAVLMTPPYLQFFDANGVPLNGGKVYTYTATGTFSVPKATYTDSTGNVEHPNPVRLDPSGRPETGNGSIWLSGTYDFKVTDSLDNLIKTTQNVTAFTTLPASSDSYFQSFSGTGAQTAFTTSEDLGTDEKAIYVWVDAGAGKGYEIQDPSAYTISATTLTFNSAPASGTNNIYVSAPSLLVGAASSAAADAASSAADAAASAAAAGAYAGQVTITSSSSVAVGTGSKTFTVASGLSLSAGQFILVANTAAPTTNYMWGQISSYSSTTLQVSVSATAGSGTYTAWTMYLTGERGTTGATGSISDFTGVSIATASNNDYLVFQDVSASNVTMKDTISNILSLSPQTLTLLQTQTASSSVSIAFSSTYITSTYKKYIVEMIDIIPSTNGVLLNMVVSTDNGSTYKTGASDYTQAGYRITASGTLGSVAIPTAASIAITPVNGIDNGADNSLNAILHMFNPNSSVHKSFLTQVVHDVGSPNVQNCATGASYIGSTTAINNIKFLMSSGNIASGTFKLYGVL